MDYSKAAELAKAFDAEVKPIYDRYNALFAEAYGDAFVRFFPMESRPQFSRKNPSEGFEFDFANDEGDTQFYRKCVDGVMIYESVSE